MPNLERAPLRINLVTDVPETLMRRQELDGAPNTWLYSTEPVDADVHVVYGLVRKLRFIGNPVPRVFVAVEPPEIFEYDRRVLLSYDTVLAGSFPYLAQLPNVKVASGLLNWHAGIDFSKTPPSERLSLVQLTNAAAQQRANRVSVITSLKVMTPMQRRRIQFVEYLQRHLSELDVYGRDTRPVGDKSEAMLPSRFHLALENNNHPYYWTEKLADPILCRCHVFYSGAHPLDSELDRAGITEVTLDDFDASYGRIARRLERDWDSSDDAAMLHNWQFLTTTANLHARLSSLAASLQRQRTAHAERSIPSHRIAYRERLRFLRERLRTSRPSQ